MLASGCSSFTGRSVSTFTAVSQGGLQTARQTAYMTSLNPLKPATPAERVAWAIERSGKTLTALAQEIGCSHAALSQWQNGHTPLETVKSGLLHAFAERTGVDVRWLLTGQGPAVSRYVMRSEVERITVALQVMESRAPQQVETIVRMVEAAAQSTQQP